MYPVRAFHNHHPCTVVEEQAFKYCEARAASVVFVLLNLPYNIKRVQDDEIFDHKIFSFYWNEGHVEVFQKGARAWTTLMYFL